MKNKFSTIYFLGLSLAKRDIAAQYRQTYLGYVWAVLPPFVMSLTFMFLNSTGVVNVSDNDISYPVYVFTGTIFWQMFCDCINNPMKAIITNKQLLTKIDFPREALIFEAFLNTCFSLLIKLVLLIIVLIFFDANLSLHSFASMIPIFSLFLIGIFIGISLSPLGALYDDVQFAMPIILGFLIFFMPVLYVPPSGSQFNFIYDLNPISILLMSIRDTLYGNDFDSLLYPIVFSIILLFFLIPLSIKIYKIIAPHLIERMEA